MNSTGFATCPKQVAFFFDFFLKFSYNTFGIRFANSELVAAKEKLEIVKSRGEAAPNSRGLPRRLRRRNAFGLIQEYCTNWTASSTAERLVYIQDVVGSNPAPSTIVSAGLQKKKLIA